MYFGLSSCYTVHRPNLVTNAIQQSRCLERVAHIHCPADTYGLGWLFFQLQERIRQLKLLALVPLSPFRALPPFHPKVCSVLAKSPLRWKSPHLSKDFPEHWTEMLNTLAGRHLSGTEEITTFNDLHQPLLGPSFEGQNLDFGNWRLSDLTHFEGHRIPPGNTLRAT